MMMNKQNVVAALRRDVTFVGNVVVAVVFVGFAGLAVAATVFDLVSIHHSAILASLSDLRRITMPLPFEILDHDVFAAVIRLAVFRFALDIVRPDR